MAAKNTDKSTMNPSQIDDLGFFPTIKMGITLPIKTSLKVGASGLIIADAMATSLYENKEELAKTAKQGVKQTITLFKAGVVATAKLNKEMGEAMGVNLNDDIDTIIENIYKKEEQQ